jgi:hypothetical protein
MTRKITPCLLRFMPANCPKPQLLLGLLAHLHAATLTWQSHAQGHTLKLTLVTIAQTMRIRQTIICSFTHNCTKFHDTQNTQIGSLLHIFLYVPSIFTNTTLNYGRLVDGLWMPSTNFSMFIKLSADMRQPCACSITLLMAT